MKVAVIGAGVIGLTCAYELGRRGLDVIVLARSQPGKACSSGNAGWLVPALSAPLPSPELKWGAASWIFKRESPLYIKASALPYLVSWLFRFWKHCNPRDYQSGLQAIASLNHKTFELFDRLERDGLEFEMHRSGLLALFLDPSKASHLLEDLGNLREHGYRVPELLSPREVRALEPAVSHRVGAGLWIEQERHIRPETFTDALLAGLPKQGVQVRSGVDVVPRLNGKGHLECLDCNIGKVEADVFLICAGAWSKKLAGLMGKKIPLQAGKGYSVTIRDPDLSLRHPLFLGEAKAAVSPFDGALRVAGTMELSGLNSHLDAKRVSAMMRGASSFVPGIEKGRSTLKWTGMRPMTPDGLPLIGRLGEEPNLYIATGHAFLGVTLAPATAVAIADMLEHRSIGDSLNPFDPNRFQAG